MTGVRFLLIASSVFLSISAAAHAELNRWLVTSGWALASRDHGQAYKEAEAQAVSNGAGLWRDGFEPSADWRRLAESAEREPGDGVVDCSSCTLRHRALNPGSVAEKSESVTE